MIRNSSGFVFHLETQLLLLRSSTEPVRARLNLTFIVITRRHEARNKTYKCECSLRYRTTCGNTPDSHSWQGYIQEIHVHTLSQWDSTVPAAENVKYVQIRGGFHPCSDAVFANGS